MRKINIARRRIEILGQKPALYKDNSSDQELLPFSRKNEFPPRLLSISGGISRNSSREKYSGLIEVDLNAQQMAEVNPLLNSENRIQVSGTLQRKQEGVLILNLESSGKSVPKYISAKTVAEMLELSPRTVYRLHRKNNLPGIRIGRSLRFSFKDVLDYLGSCAEGVEG